MSLLAPHGYVLSTESIKCIFQIANVMLLFQLER